MHSARQRCLALDRALPFSQLVVLTTDDATPCLPPCFLQGQAWIDKVRACLISAIFVQYKNNANCQQVKDAAFNSHTECYVSSGFCTTIVSSITNLRGLYNVLSTKLSVFFSRLSIKQVRAIHINHVSKLWIRC